MTFVTHNAARMRRIKPPVLIKLTKARGFNPKHSEVFRNLNQITI